MSGRWGIVEVMGHQVHAGLVTDEVVLGVPMCCVQQPGRVREWEEAEYIEGGRRTRAIIERYPETRFEIGAGSIYRRTFASEEAVRKALRHCTYGHQEPERIEGPWQESVRARLTGPVEDADEVEEDDGIPFDEDDCDPVEQARRYALAEQPCPRGPCIECEGDDPMGHHWNDAWVGCKHCDAERPDTDDGDDCDEETQPEAVAS